MKFFIMLKKKVMTKSNGDGHEVWSPLPTPPPSHRTCNKPESYSLPVDITWPPRQKQPSPPSESRHTRPQYPAEKVVPVSPRMKVLGTDGRDEEKTVSCLKSQKKSKAGGWPWLPSDRDLSDQSSHRSPQRDSNSAHMQKPSPSNKRGSSNGHVAHCENPSPAGSSANRSVRNGFRPQEYSTSARSMYRNSDDENECSLSSFQFSPSTTDLADNSSSGKASPANVSTCSTPPRSPRRHMINHGKSFGPLNESFHKPCKLPSPPRSPWRTQNSSKLKLDSRSQTCSSKTATVLQDLATRQRTLPTLNLNRETSSRPYLWTPPTSPRPHYKPSPSTPTSPRPHYKPSPSTPTSPRPHKLTPPSSPRPFKIDPVVHLENEDVLIFPKSPRRSTISYPYQDSSGNAPPLCRVLQPVPKPPQRWKRGAKIGSGSFGCVYEGWNLDDGTFFAVKVSDSDHIPPEIHQEVAMLSRLRHPNIVQYYGTTSEDGSICIFLELVKMGSLQSIMKKFQVFDEVLISSYTRQILTGLEYLHSTNTVHRDIKCANILVDSDGQVKLADFGLAKQMKESMASSVKGSPYYMAPEILLPGRNKRPYGLPVDIWSLGCTVLEMADGNPPWSGLQGYAFFFKVTNGELPPIPQHLSNTAKDFITQCLRQRPEDRPTVKDLLVHPFVAHAPRTFRASVPARD